MWRPLKKTAPASRKPAKTSERELVLEAVSRATGVHFELVPPHPAFPLPVERLEWFMRCRNKEEIAMAPYLNVVWKEKKVGIWMESLAVGDTVDWIELAYGDEQAGKSLDIDYSRLDDPAFRQEFGQKFPIVSERIREYEGVAAAVSKSAKVNLEIRRAGSKGMLVFTVAALLKEKKGIGQRALGNAITKSASALKEAYEQIQKL